MIADIACVDCGRTTAPVYVTQRCSFSVSPRAYQLPDGTAEESFCSDCWRKRERAAAADAEVDDRAHRHPAPARKRPRRRA
jgi:hypothetical protein